MEGARTQSSVHGRTEGSHEKEIELINSAESNVPDQTSNSLATLKPESAFSRLQKALEGACTPRCGKQAGIWRGVLAGTSPPQHTQRQQPSQESCRPLRSNCGTSMLYPLLQNQGKHGSSNHSTLHQGPQGPAMEGEGGGYAQLGHGPQAHRGQTGLHA